MSYELSIEADAFLQQDTIVGNIILELDGFPSLYGSIKVTKMLRIGEFTIGDGSLIGGAIVDETSKDYIELNGTTNNITQKLNQDKGGASSVTSFNIRLIDKAGELTRDFSPNFIVSDILGNEANVYWQASGSKFPEDATRLISGGIVSDADFGQGYVNIKISLSQQLARQQLLPKITAKSTTAIDNAQTTISVDSTTGFTIGGDAMSSYVRIDDELIAYTSITGTDLQGCVRGQLGTIAAAHDDDSDVDSFYRLQGDPIDLSLKLLLSNPDTEEFATKTTTAINQISANEFIQNSLYFKDYDISDTLGLTVGDFVSITSGALPNNTFGYVEIIGFGKASTGSYIILNQQLDTEVDISATCLFKSKYNTLTFGARMKPTQVDVQGFIDLQTQFGSQFFIHDEYIKDSEIDSCKDYIEQNLLFPNSLFGLPRKGKIGAGISAPPVVAFNAKTISSDTVTNASKLMMSRSINKFFYNSIAYKFNIDAINDKFLAATITTDEDSQARVKVGNKTMTIEAGGVRESETNRQKIKSITRRLLDRYSVGAETLQVETNFKTGFPIETGDTVIIDGASLKLSDINNGSRDFVPRVFEVQNKAINLKNGKAKLTLVDTNLSTARRYGVFAPASYIGVGSDTSNIIIKRSFGTTNLELERDKWNDYLIQRVQVRSQDFSQAAETNLVGFDNSNPDLLKLNPPLPFVPNEDYIIESADYDESSQQVQGLWKALHCFFNPRVTTISGDTQSFTVSALDAAKFKKGASLDIHSNDFVDQEDATVASVVGNTVNLNKAVAFTITANYEIDLIGFGDGGASYAWY